jgi:hypothetical protein
LSYNLYTGSREGELPLAELYYQLLVKALSGRRDLLSLCCKYYTEMWMATVCQFPVSIYTRLLNLFLCDGCSIVIGLLLISDQIRSMKKDLSGRCDLLSLCCKYYTEMWMATVCQFHVSIYTRLLYLFLCDGCSIVIGLLLISDQIRSIVAILHLFCLENETRRFSKLLQYLSKLT